MIEERSNPKDLLLYLAPHRNESDLSRKAYRLLVKGMKRFLIAAVMLVMTMGGLRAEAQA
jgi:hypothetical protein